jgi:hypothetical protein
MIAGEAGTTGAMDRGEFRRLLAAKNSFTAKCARDGYARDAEARISVGR